MNRNNRSLTGNTIDCRDQGVYLLLGAMALIYVVARAWMVPLVGDEARTFFLYNEVGRFQPWYAYWDAANHLLCTALAQVCYLLLGPVAWSLRLPSVLSFGAYLWYVWRIGALLLHRRVRWAFWAAMVLMPMLIEFFSLYRGYGMGIAFLLMAVFHLLRFARTGAHIHFLGALVGMMLATYASFTLMLLWASVLVLLALMAFREARGRNTPRGTMLRGAALWLVLGALPLAYLATYSMELSKRDALYYGTTEGLVRGSLHSVLYPMFPFDLHVRDLVFVLGISALLVHAFFVATTRKGWDRTPPVVVLGALLFMEIAGRYFLNATSGVLFPVDRAALHFVPLIVMLFAFSIDRASVERPKLQWAMAALLIFPVTTFRYANVDHVSVWPGDPISEEVFAAAENLQRAADRPLAIGSTEFLRYGWALRNMADGSDLPQLQNVPDGCTGTDLLLLHVADTMHAPEYHRVAGKATDAVVLCARNTPLPLELLLDTLVPPSHSMPDPWMLWDPPVGSAHADELLLVLDAVITSSASPLEALMVWETGPGDRSVYSYSELKLALQRTSWQGDTLRLARWVPLPGHGTEHMDMRIWNIRDQDLSVGYCRLRVYRIRKAKEAN